MKNNKYLIVLMFLMFVPFFNVNAQTKEDVIADLEIKIENTNSLEDEVKYCADLAELFMDSNLSKSMEYVNRAEKILKKNTFNSQLQADVYGVFGAVYYYKIDYKNALKSYESELEALEVIGTQKEILDAKYNIAVLAYKDNKLKKSRDYYIDILETAKITGNFNMQLLANKALYVINSKLKKTDLALKYIDSYLLLIDEQFSDEISIVRDDYKVEKIKRVETEHQLDYTEYVLDTTSTTLKVTDSALVEVTYLSDSLQIGILKQSLEIADLKYQKLEQQRILEATEAKRILQEQINASQQRTIIMLIGLLILIFGGGFLIWILYRRIKNQNNTLHIQKLEIKTQHDEIKEKNTQITESIFYARRLQTAILVPEAVIQQNLPNTFIYYKPRDIVSGDFYWFAKIDDKYIISAIDCTGHGVPGAFLSMIGNTLLNKIINENQVILPNEILNQLHEGMVTALQQSSDDSDTEDGMDMTLVTIFPKENKFIVAAAKNSLIIVNEDEIEVSKSDFHSIGEKPLRPGAKITFNNYEYEYTNLTSIYLMTDGYTDQFGGESGEDKFNSSRMKELIQENHLKSIETQKEIFAKTMIDWKGENAQLDDMLVVGVNLSDIAE